MMGLAAAALGAGAAIWGANKAASTQSAAAQQAAALQQQQIAKNDANFGTFIEGGKGANNLLQSFYGLGGDPALGASALERFSQSPDYQFALKGGSEALDNSAAAKGGVLGGNQIRAQTEYGAGLATQNLKGYLDRLQAMSGQGITAAGGTASANMAGAKYAGDAMMGAGTAEASGYLGMANAINGKDGKGGFLNNLSLYNQMGKSSYGGSGYLGSYSPNTSAGAIY
jgi:hypothetical protein